MARLALTLVLAVLLLSGCAASTNSTAPSAARPAKASEGIPASTPVVGQQCLTPQAASHDAPFLPVFAGNDSTLVATLMMGLQDYSVASTYSTSVDGTRRNETMPDGHADVVRDAHGDVTEVYVERHLAPGKGSQRLSYDTKIMAQALRLEPAFNVSTDFPSRQSNFVQAFAGHVVDSGYLAVSQNATYEVILIPAGHDLTHARLGVDEAYARMVAATAAECRLRSDGQSALIPSGRFSAADALEGPPGAWADLVFLRDSLVYRVRFPTAGIACGTDPGANSSTEISVLVDTESGKPLSAEYRDPCA